MNDVPTANEVGTCREMNRPSHQQTPASNKIFVVIPAFNESRTIGELIRRVQAYTDNVIVVDDGSTDGTSDVLANLPVKVMCHKTNRGKGASLVTGFRAAIEHGASAVITLDGDGQHRPEDIPRFIDCATRTSGAIVIGYRLADRSAFPPSRYRANRIANFWISWACGYRVADSQCGFRLYPREVLEATNACHSRHYSFAFESEILINAARCGFRVVTVQIPALYFMAGARASYFRPVAHISTIVCMVAWKLMSRGMYLHGLFRMLRERRC